MNGYKILRRFIPIDLLWDYKEFLLNEIDKDANLKLHHGQFPLSVRLSDKINPIAKFLGNEPVIKAIAHSKKIYMHMPPMVRYITPSDIMAAVPAHRDKSYATWLSDFITLWIPLTDDAAITVYDASHLIEDGKTPDPEPDSWLPAIETHDYIPHKINLDAGDVLVMDKNLLHSSVLPDSAPRISIDLRIFGEKGKSSKHCMDLDTLIVRGNKP